MKGLFVSDLHLFSQRSMGQARWEASVSDIQTADLVVLGGDIFDLRWSRLGTLSKTIHAAEEWLKRAVAVNPDARWIFLPGNHDCHPEMVERLANLSSDVSRFEWHPTHWQIGDHVFLHGDVLDAVRHPSGLEGYRAAFHEHKPKGKVANLLYSAVIASRIHGVVPRVRHSADQTCSKLLGYLQNECEIDPQDIRTVYFGHTHVPVFGYVYKDVTFHNPGSGIRHLTYAPVSFEVSER